MGIKSENQKQNRNQTEEIKPETEPKFKNN